MSFSSVQIAARRAVSSSSTIITSLSSSLRCFSTTAAPSSSASSSTDSPVSKPAPTLTPGFVSLLQGHNPEYTPNNSTPPYIVYPSKNKVLTAIPKNRKSKQQLEQEKIAKAAAKPRYSVEQAVRLVKAMANAPFDETLEMAVQLNLDPRRPNQSIRGLVTLPHGTGAKVRVAVFARGEKEAEAKRAGADIVGAQDLADAILAGKIEFDRCIAAPDMMGVVSKVARILGPRGLMPNPKVGTVTADIAGAVRGAKAGSLEVKTDKTGMIHAPIGKSSFSNQAVIENITSLANRLVELKPLGAAKGAYFLTCAISSSQGPAGVQLDLSQQPFASVLNQASTTEKAAQAAGVSKKLHSVGGYRVVRYDLGPFPEQQVLQTATAPGKWQEVAKAIKDSKAKSDDWPTVLQKLADINARKPEAN